ncbi:hypothetical protein FOZ63_012403, partial [Perkinsus olseni]
ASASELRQAVNEGVGGAPKLPRVKFMTKKEREKMAKDMEKQKKQAAKEKAEELRKRWYWEQIGDAYWGVGSRQLSS